MNTPDPPEDESQNGATPDPAELDESIDALENIITTQVKTTKRQDLPDIPVLDDIVESGLDEELPDDDEVVDLEIGEDIGDTGYPGATMPASPGVTQGQLDALLEVVDEKLATELDSLLDLLKGAIKDSVITELRLQLQSKPIKRSPSGSKEDQEDKAD